MAAAVSSTGSRISFLLDKAQPFAAENGSSGAAAARCEFVPGV